MGNYANMASLAETLHKMGICTSGSEAAMMAQNIIGTEARVSKSMDEKSSRVYGNFKDPMPKTMTYQEEIDYLIKKTSPEYKQYHIPIKGYKREDVPKAQEQSTHEAKPEVAPVESQVVVPSVVNVHTDLEADGRPLSEVMETTENATPAFESVPEPEVKITIREPEDDFIVSLPDSPQVQKEPEQPEPMFREIKEDKTQRHEVKNPIEKVDLMNFFKK